MRYLGVDLHTNCFTVCFRDESGRETLKTYQIKKLFDFLRDIDKKDIVAVESTGNTRFFVESITKVVKKVVVVDPNKFDVIKKSTKKTKSASSRLTPPSPRFSTCATSWKMPVSANVPTTTA